MSNLRFQAVAEASKRKPVEVAAPSERPSEFFGKKVFNRQKMYKYLPADVYPPASILLKSLPSLPSVPHRA